MPYIKQDRRKKLEPILKLMEELGVEFNGEINYLIYAYAKSVSKKEPSYNKLKNIIGEIRCCADEMGRRILAPYEDKKIEENGDV